MNVRSGLLRFEFERAEIVRGSLPRFRIIYPRGEESRNILTRLRIEANVVLDAGFRRVPVTVFRARRDQHEWLEIPPPLRGLYRFRSVELVIPDPLRLSSLRLTISLDPEVHLRVLPRAEDAKSFMEVHGYGGIDLRNYLSLERNEDLIEARPYHPGDDATRLHWSLYAHTGELFVRLGEEVPPPRRSVVVAVDAQAAGDDLSESGARALDRVIEYALGLAVTLRDRGFTVAVALSTKTATQNLGVPATAAHTLAALDVDGRLLEPPSGVPADGRGTMLCVTTGLAERCPADLRGRSVVVLLMDEIDGSRVQRAWNARPLD